MDCVGTMVYTGAQPTSVAKCVDTSIIMVYI